MFRSRLLALIWVIVGVAIAADRPAYPRV